jgi:quinoprotein glucose dehydrogenase
MVYLQTKREVQVTAMIRNTDPAVSDMDWIGSLGTPKGEENVVRDGFKVNQTTVDGLPLLKPPYGALTAIDLTKGEIAWRIAHGETPDNVRNHPALKGLTIPRTGQIGKLAALVTKTLLVIGDPQTTTDASGRRGAMLRAYDKATGAELGAVYLPGGQVGSAMTYMAGGRQYIVLSIGGGSVRAEFIAFRLPKA